MKTEKEFDPNRVARDLDQHLQDAVGDVAADMTSEGSGFLDEAWERRIRQARRRGVRDVQGWLADELYNDAGTIQDLIGDRLHEACAGDKKKQLLVLDALSANAHKGMVDACDELRKLIGG